jgi:DNA-binding winged helix-turn-helix (wHTH) protein
VTREELRTLIWGDGTYVSFNSCLNFCVREIRLALEDSARAPRHFETVPRRGYRFIGPVRVEIAGSGRPATARRPERLWLAAAFSLGLATGAVAAFLIGESPLHHQAVEWLHVRLDIPASHCPWPWR